VQFDLTLDRKRENDTGKGARENTYKGVKNVTRPPTWMLSWMEEIRVGWREGA